MRNITLNYIVFRVRSLMNEHASSTIPLQEEFRTGALDLEHYIIRVLREALTLCYKIAPEDLLPKSKYPTKDNPIPLYINDETPLPRYFFTDKNVDGVSFLCIELPDNYNRFIRMKMRDWVKGIDTLNTPEGNVFAEQYNIYTEGKRHRPKANLVYSPRGKKCIECHPNGIPENWKEGDPLPLEYLIVSLLPDSLDDLSATNGDSNDDFNDRKLFESMDSILFDAWCYMTASLVYGIFEDMPSSSYMERIAIALLEKRQEIEISKRNAKR